MFLRVASILSLSDSDGSGSNFFDPGRVGSIFCGSGRVESGQPFMVWVRIWKISPKNVKFSNFLPFGSKKIASGRKVPGSKPGRPLIYCGSKVSSGRVESGHGPSLDFDEFASPYPVEKTS